MDRGAACLLFSVLLLSSLQTGAAQEEPPEKAFEAEITVSLSTMVVRVVDTWGRPILGLKPEDFRVRVGKGKEIPVVSLDWISAGNPEPLVQTEPERTEKAAVDALPEPEPAVSAISAVPAVPAQGRLVVFFVQADLNPTRISGQLRMRPYTRELLDTLHPGDQAAVVSFDSHLKLWQDFTVDRGAIHAAIDQAMLFSPEAEVPPADPFSLARHFDFAEARKAASAERGLELTARAMERLPGEKTMIFLGWGLGNFGHGGVRMRPAYAPAVRALRKASVAVFVLDVTSADYHDLELGLQGVANDTGGQYFSTFRLPGLAAETLAQAISGYYVLTLDSAALAGESGTLQIELRDNKQGTVLARPAARR